MESGRRRAWQAEKNLRIGENGLGRSGSFLLAAATGWLFSDPLNNQQVVTVLGATGDNSLDTHDRHWDAQHALSEQHVVHSWVNGGDDCESSGQSHISWT
ncbi:hypothetical protein TREES_T100019177 [Tupaia chinensis]|uniref:Uncharacterized protein n=1 Tax=Tupaia chinensis TaxID=246437 RepID=L9L8H0_TUPCH|nr:hypothetical protein TREES_T100019177 [Tupaia chinensis]